MRRVMVDPNRSKRSSHLCRRLGSRRENGYDFLVCANQIIVSHGHPVPIFFASGAVTCLLITQQAIQAGPHGSPPTEYGIPLTLGD